MVKRLHEADNYGWAIDDSDARYAYVFAIYSEFGRWTKDQLNEEIVGCLSHKELAKCLEFIFRNADFNAWKDRSND